MAKENQLKEVTEYVMKHNLSGKTYVVTEDYVEKLLAVGYSIIEKKSEPPFDPDPPKSSGTNSDGSKTSPLSRAKQLAQLGAKYRKQKKEGYVSHAQRKAVWANKADGGKGHPDKKNEAVTYHGNPNKDDDARNAARRKRLAKQDKKPKPQTEASVVPSKDGKKLVPMKKHSEPKSEPVPNDQFGLPKLQKEAAYGSQAQRMMSPLQKVRQDKEKADRDKDGKLHMMKGRSKKVNEISQDLKKRYADKAKSDYGHQQFSADIAREMGAKDAEKYYRRKQKNRMAGITKATRESVELDENVIAKRAYEIMKPTKSMNHGIEALKKTMKIDHGTATNLAKQVMDKVKKGEFKEEVELTERQDIAMQVARALKKMGVKSNAKEVEVIKKIPGILDKMKLTPGARRLISRDRDFLGDVFDSLKEENVQELKKSTLGSYVKKASQDAGAKAYSAAQKAMSNPDQSGKDYVKSVKRQKGIAKATDKLTKEAGTPERLAMIRKAGEKINKEKKKAERDAKRAMSKDKDMMGEAKLDELSPATHDRYQKAAHKSAVQGVAQMRMGTRTPKSMAANQKKRQAGIDTSKYLNRKQHGVKPTYEAKPFDQKFRDHLKFATSKSPAVQAYMKKRAADRDAMNKANDPNAAKKGYALSAVPPERAFKKARKKGMSASDASQAVGTASRNRGKKLPK